MKPTVYIETTVPSYYCDDRPELARDIARTRKWWDEERGDYNCFVSSVVVDELSAGRYATKADCLALVAEMPVLRIVPDVLEIARVYQAQSLMPVHPAADSIHLALASYYRMEYLLTWNCRHLANAQKAVHYETINARLHLGLPRLITPHQLEPWEDDI